MSAAARPGEEGCLPKEDPETLRLRGRPRPVTRFRRGFVIAVAAGASGTVAVLAWSALDPVSSSGAAAEASRAAGRPSLDAIATAPSTYSDVPRLGPPLPGDLGRAILGRQRGPGRAHGPQAAEGAGSAGGAPSRAAELDEARASPVLVRLARPSKAGLAGVQDRPGSEASRPAPPAARSDEAGRALERPRSRWTLAAGTVIPASLLTGLNSDLPGTVVAQVTGDVRDSATGRTVLIPRGARLVGDYDSHVEFGQERVVLAWNRLLFPDGSSVGLGAMPATDAAGFSGLADRVDFHGWRLLKGVLLSSLLGVGGELATHGDDRDLVRAIRESAGRNGSQAGERIVSRDLEVRPTLTVRPGWPVRAILHRDLVLEPWRGW